MASIDIHHAHVRSMKDARAAVERVAEHISEKFGMRHSWDGDHLDFSGSGVNGRITLDKKSVHVTASLDFLRGMFKGPIEAEIHRYLEREFG
jgi:putative polyhydroxyalkanoate system protein